MLLVIVAAFVQHTPYNSKHHQAGAAYVSKELSLTSRFTHTDCPSDKYHNLLCSQHADSHLDSWPTEVCLDANDARYAGLHP